MSDQNEANQVIPTFQAILKALTQSNTENVWLYQENIRGRLRHNFEWLIKEPRSLSEIMQTLFPGEITSMKDLPEMEMILARNLQAEGYIPATLDGTWIGINVPVHRLRALAKLHKHGQQDC
jgi:hypothetical protein